MEKKPGGLLMLRMEMGLCNIEAQVHSSGFLICNFNVVLECCKVKLHLSGHGFGKLGIP